MDIYQFATAFWDQVYEEQEAKKSQKQKESKFKLDRQYLRNGKKRSRFLQFQNLE
ncbi:hypothetical protein [Dyadobacter tibetensis]|uniref:hypothetical protein n=1 Tax=Dyadobacter tibetensis TaxID=1211851 RepID=UPI0004B7BF5E|nr:hypothetical protein [Dyadobacter tibetensis]